MNHICYKCKSLTDSFYESSIKKKDYICKSCSVKRGREQRKERTDRNDLNSRYSYAKASAKTSKKKWCLTKEQYFQIVSQNCHYCSLPSQGLGVGLDRIDNDKSIGYTVDNILPCCKDCNRIRGPYLTVEEMEVAMKAVVLFRKKKNN